MVQFLTFVCSKYFEGHASQIKEYTIAVDAFGRPPDFQQKEDPIVRVEANRLRKRLKQYYETEGRSHAVQISIPPGQYSPSFEHRREPQETAPAEASPGESIPEIELTEALVATTALQRSNGDSIETYDVDRGITLDSGRSRSKAVWENSLRYVVPLAFLIGFLAIVGWWLTEKRHAGNASVGTRSEQDSANAPSLATDLKTASTFAQEHEVRILVGSTISKYVDRLGRVWSGDRYFKGGSTFKFLVLPILRTSDPEIYQSGREGDFEYTIPLKPGIYELHLHFAELIYGPDEAEGGGETSRLIHVQANGKPLLQTFDVFADAGGSRTADVRVFTDIVPVDGNLRLSVFAYRGRGLLNAMEILPGIPGQMRPLRMTTRQSAHFDKKQAMWEPDRYFRGGRVNARTNPIAGTDEPELYQCERFGNFSYAIPVAPGRYKLTLKFAETYWGETNPGEGGLGSRVFDVSCNGEPLLRNFDIYKEAGGENRALDRTFRGLQANAQGKLMLTFVPVQNYASVSSIEVVPEPSSRGKQ